MATCTEFIGPLNLECIFVNTFAGDPQIFIFIAFIAIAAMAAYFNMSGLTLALGIGAFVLLMTSFLDLNWALFLIASLIVLIVIPAINRVFKN